MLYSVLGSQPQTPSNKTRSVCRGEGACPLPSPVGAAFEQPGVVTPGWQADNSPSPEGPAETPAVGRPFGARRIGFAHTWGCHPRLFKGRPFRAGGDKPLP